MQKKLQFFLCAVFLALPLCSLAGEPLRSPFKAQLVGLAEARLILDDLPKEQALFFKRPLHLQAFIPGLGRVKFEFDRERQWNRIPVFTAENGVVADQKRARLLRGSAVSANGVEGAAASLFYVNGTPYLFVGFLGRTRRSGNARYHRLSVPLLRATGQASIRRTSRLDRNLTLAKAGSRLPSSAPLSSSEAPGSEPWVIELNIDADAGWYKKYRSSSNTMISTFINEAEVFYEKQLGITFELKRQNVFRNRSFDGNTAERRLVSYQKYTAEQAYFPIADAHHLFTGQAMERGVVGISYVSVICVSPYDSFAMTRQTSSAFIPITFAHELAHNLGAGHDVSETSIMNAVLSYPPPQSFSAYSIGQIKSFVQYYGRCLTENTSLTAQIPIRLSAAVTRGGVVTLQTRLDRDYPDCTIDLLASTRDKKVFKGRVLASFSAAAKKSVRARLRRKALRAGEPVDIFVGARITCPGGSAGQSRVRKISTGIIRAGKSLPPAQWLGRLGSLLQGK